VYVEGQPSIKALAHLERGVRLREGMTAPAQVELQKSDAHGSWVKITIHEGRYHQVKRMFERVGYPVLQLIRIKLGPFSLEQLPDKKLLFLSADQLRQIASDTPSSYSKDAAPIPAEEKDL
jgi:pseudouridine synthase